MIVTDRDEALKAGAPMATAATATTTRGCRSPAPPVLHPRACTLPALALPPPQIAIGAKTVAVLGIKTENHAGQPAFFVPEYLQSVGCKIIPVPGACAAASEGPRQEGGHLMGCCYTQLA